MSVTMVIIIAAFWLYMLVSPTTDARHLLSKVLVRFNDISIKNDNKSNYSYRTLKWVQGSRQQIVQLVHLRRVTP